MELLDRYLNSIRSCLPEAQRDDIVNELSENLHAQIEDKEAKLGCPLSEAEVEAVLKRHGHPLVVATRFRQDQRSVAFGKQWIGPVLAQTVANLRASRGVTRWPNSSPWAFRSYGCGSHRMRRS
jgi:hypothetical protein